MPTKRAPDAGESAQISGSFLRLFIFLAGRLRRPRPSAGNANRWAVPCKIKSPLKIRKSVLNIFLPYFLPIYLVTYFFTAFIWRSYIVWKTTGIKPYTFGKTDTAHDFVGILFRLTLLSCAIVVCVYSFLPDWYKYLVPVFWLLNPIYSYVGIGLLSISLIWTFVAQLQMGNSWRIGIDAEHKTELIQTGIFRLSRNPIFLGMRLTLLGLFFILPNVATFAIIVVGDVLMQIQVRLEEEFLSHTHGIAYQDYCQKTRRWI